MLYMLLILYICIYVYNIIYNMYVCLYVYIHVFIYIYNLYVNESGQVFDILDKIINTQLEIIRKGKKNLGAD